MLDQTIIHEQPPLYSCYGRRNQPHCVPITGKKARRILHGAINIHTGEVLLVITKVWQQWDSQGFLGLIRRHWRGWNLILFQDRASQHTAPLTVEHAQNLKIEIRWLPKATPELNAMDHLWRHMKKMTQASRRKLKCIDESALHACQYILNLTPYERLVQAGVYSGNFWLTK